MRKKWTQEKVIEEIHSLVAHGNPVHERHVLLNYNPLRCAARKCFGSWRKALLAAGVDPDEVASEAWGQAVASKKIWTRERILAILKERVEMGVSVHYSALKRDGFESLLVSVPREFGTFENCIHELGLDYDQIRGDREFTDWASDPNMILDKIREYDADGYELNASSIQEHDKSLLWAARNYYGSWYDAVAAAGFDAEAVRQDRDRQADKGNIFENISYEIFAILRPNWKRGCFFDCDTHKAYPDLVDLKTSTWIDFKLRAYGESSQKAVNLYAPFAPSLQIIYLFGRREDFENVSFVSIYDFEKESSSKRLKKLFSQLREIESYKPPPLHLEKWCTRWSKELIIEEIQKLPLGNRRERIVLQNNNDLRCAARRLFGSWSKALRAAGTEPDSIRLQRKKISSDELDHFITDRWETGGQLNSRYICDNFASEYNAAIRIYGGWRQAVEANGIAYDQEVLRKTHER